MSPTPKTVKKRRVATTPSGANAGHWSKNRHHQPPARRAPLLAADSYRGGSRGGILLGEMPLGDLGSADGGRTGNPSVLVVLCGFHDTKLLGKIVDLPRLSRELDQRAFTRPPGVVDHETRVRAIVFVGTYNLVDIRACTVFPLILVFVVRSVIHSFQFPSFHSPHFFPPRPVCPIYTSQLRWSPVPYLTCSRTVPSIASPPQ
ncbi:hypothetical protein LZ30DRAFT_403138 [Colletotrichum cereale]|nr:hypothetical protein LZ30DRAFT_403138 [Colletotrichum cereale]